MPKENDHFLETLFSLKGKNALVTGGGAGLGRIFSLALARAGANLAVVDMNEESLKSTAAEIKALGSDALPLVANVTLPEQVADMSKIAVEHFGKIDILVNNAGINKTAPAEVFKVEDWQLVIGVNLTGVFLCSQAVGKYMIQRKYGKIINISSMHGIVASSLHDAVAYNSAKAGVINLTKSLAVEWAKYNINVNTIAPGMIETALTRQRVEDPEYRKKVFEKTPIARLGQPDDLIGALIYLASPASDWVTGAAIVVDGGYVAC